VNVLIKDGPTGGLVVLAAVAVDGLGLGEDDMTSGLEYGETGQSGAFAHLLSRSFTEVMGAELVPDGVSEQTATHFLYTAPFGLLAQDRSPDPLFVYANLAAQKLFEYSWDEFVGLPSRLSAGEQDRAGRQAFMDSVRRNGYADGYRGQRVAKSGRRFWIEDTTVWNVVTPESGMVGQAALIRHWTDA
jgi:PAS domain-containing protein